MKPTDIFAVLDLAKRANEQGLRFNPLFVSPPGLGKSEIVHQWAKQENYRVIDIRAAYLEAPDMIGFPSVKILENGKAKTVHNPPDFWPDETDTTPTVVFFDEVNRGNTSVMNTLMQILTDGKVHTHKLPKGVIYVACINPETAENDVNSMDAALRDRFEIFDINYDKKTFVQFMKDNDWDVPVRLFVESGAWEYKTPEEISNVDGAKYLSPRSFSKLNAARLSQIPEKLEYDIYTSLLGKITGKAFDQFVKKDQPVVYEDLVSNFKESIEQIKKFSDPNNYKSGHLSITVKSIVDNAHKVEEDILAALAEALPVEQSMTMISELEFKLGLQDGSKLRGLVTKYPNLKKRYKEVLKSK